MVGGRGKEMRGEKDGVFVLRGFQEMVELNRKSRVRYFRQVLVGQQIQATDITAKVGRR